MLHYLLQLLLSKRSEENLAFFLEFIANIYDENISCEKFDIIYVPLDTKGGN